MDDVKFSPLWWVAQLEKRLLLRRVECDLANSYYTGQHPLPTLAGVKRDHVAAYHKLLKRARANWMGLVIDAVSEREKLEGIRFAEGTDADRDAWKLLQRNGIDAASEMAQTECHTHGEIPILVWNDPGDPETPRITIEHPSQMISADDPATGKRLATLKMWADEWGGGDLATLYLPDGIYKFRSSRPSDAEVYTGVRLTGAPVSAPVGGLWFDDVSIQRRPIPQLILPSSVHTNRSRWVPRQVRGEKWPLPNPLGVVPVVTMRNRPRLLTGGRSEIDDVTDSQDRYNSLLFGLLMATEFAAYPQKWATGLEVPLDPITGNPREPFHMAVDRLLWNSNPDARFGQFEAGDLTNYTKAGDSVVRDIAATTHTPPHYLLGAMVNVSGDALKAAEAGLISKVRRRQTHFGEAWENVIRLAYRVLEDPRADDYSAEVLWADPEYRTEGELVSSIVQMRSIGMSLRTSFERYGMSPQQIDTEFKRIADERRDLGVQPGPLGERRVLTAGSFGAMPELTTGGERDAPII